MAGVIQGGGGDASSPVPAEIDQIRLKMLRYAGPEDSPAAQAVMGLVVLAERIGTAQTAMETRLSAAGLEDIARQAFRQGIAKASQETARGWRWQRRAAAAVAVSVSAVALIFGTWFIATDVARRLDATEAAQWRAWCAAPQNIRSLPGGRYCVIRLSEGG